MSIVLFGGTGTLGHALAKIIDSQGDRCTVISRCELRQKEMAKLYPKFNYVLGDVTDQTHSWSTKVLEPVRYVFNLAAMKHVELGETNVEHCIRVNYEGVVNTHRWCTSVGARYVFTSTDKAVLPVNTYGMAKALAEKYLFDKKDSVIFRHGNVLASRGSVFHAIKNCIESGDTFTLTHPDMNRFFAHIDDIASYMWERKGMVTTKDPHIAPMKAASMKRLLAVMGLSNYEVGSIRPGEKITEVLRTGHDWCLNSQNGDQYSDKELTALVKRCLK